MRLPPPGRAAAILLLAAVVAVGSATAAPAAPGRAAAAVGAAASTGPMLSVGNGRVNLTFPGPFPAYTVAAPGAPIAVTQTLAGIAEVTPDGYLVAYAGFEAADLRWNFTSTAAAGGTVVAATAAVPANATGGDWESGDDGAPTGGLGSVNVSIEWSVNASSAPNPSTVAYTIRVSDWPWQHAEDALGIEVLTNATGGGAGVWAPSGADALALTAGTGGASFRWGSSAVADYATGRAADGAVEDAYRSISPNGQTTLIRLDFTNVTGGYSHLRFDPWLTVLGPTSAPVPAAWIVGGGALGAVAAGGLLSAAFAAGAAVRRRRAGRVDRLAGPAPAACAGGGP